MGLFHLYEILFLISERKLHQEEQKKESENVLM